MKKIGWSWYVVPKKVRRYAMPFVWAVLLCSLFSATASALPWDTPTTEAWHFRADTHTVNDYLGYVLNTSRSDTETTVTIAKDGAGNLSVALRIYVVRASNTTVELTTGYDTNVTRTTDSNGTQTVSFTPANTDLYLGADAVLIDLYMQYGGSYQKKVILVTSRLQTEQLQNSTWTFYLWTGRNSTTGIFKWGISTYPSRVTNIQFQTLPPWKTMQHHLNTQNFILFIVTPWTYYIGNYFYAILTFFFFGTTYNRYGRIEPVIVLAWIFGGAGGILTLVLPIGLPIAWFLLALALASTIYLLMR